MAATLRSLYVVRTSSEACADAGAYQLCHRRRSLYRVFSTACRANAGKRRSKMTLCPIAIVVGCKKCLAFTACPLKSVIGDYKKPDETQTTQHADKAQTGEKRDQ